MTGRRADPKRAVDVRRVEQGDAGVQRGVHDLTCLLEPDPAAEIVAAKANGGDLQAGAAHASLLHR